MDGLNASALAQLILSVVLFILAVFLMKEGVSTLMTQRKAKTEDNIE